MKILHLELDKYTAEAIKSLERYDLEVYACENQGDLYNKVSGHQYDVIFTRLGLAIDKTVIDAQPELKYIVSPTTGLNHIDIEYALGRGIEIISLKGEVEFLKDVRSTAEHTIALMLAVMRNIVPASNSVKNGSWTREPFIARELNGKKLGVIGYGRLGKMVADYGRCFGMEVWIHDTDPNKLKDVDDSIVIPGSLEKLLKNADIVTLHIDYNSENHHFCGSDFFQKIKKGAVFINTSRGELVDEEIFLESLLNGRIAVAGIDVMDGDSTWDGRVPVGNKLIEYARNHNNLLITPHMGGYGQESVSRTRKFITKKFINTVNNQ